MLNADEIDFGIRRKRLANFLCELGQNLGVRAQQVCDPSQGRRRRLRSGSDEKAGVQADGREI